ARRHLPGQVDLVLDRERDAEQRRVLAGPAARVGLIGLRDRPLRVDGRERVELAVERGDALQRELHELARRDVAGRQGLRLTGHAGPRELFVAGHGPTLLRLSGARGWSGSR